MSTNHHTPLVFQSPRTAANLNAPLGELDAAITAVDDALAQTALPITTTDAQAASGQKVVPVTSTDGFVVGQPFWIGDVGGTFEVPTIASIQAGISLTTVVNLTNTYAAGKVVSGSPAELVEARSTFSTLSARLNVFVLRRAADRAATIDSGTNDVPAIIAHRGYTRSAPENTMEAFRTALAAGIKIIETDIVWSIDGVPMVLHDTTIDRTVLGFGGGSLQYSSQELRQLDAGSFYSSHFADEGIPSLYDLLDEFGGKCTMIIEIKDDIGGESHAQTANRIADIIAEYGLEAFTIIADFNDLSGSDVWTQHGIPLLRYAAAIDADGSVGGKTPASHFTDGYRYLGLKHGITNFGAGASAWGAVGAKVLTYTPPTRKQRDDALAASASVTGVLCDDPQYQRKPNLAAISVNQNIPFNAPLLPYGVIPFKFDGTNRVENPPAEGNEMGVGGQDGGKFGWPAYGASANAQILVLGALGWGASGVGKLSADMKLNATATSLTRWGGLDVYTDDRGNVVSADSTTGYRMILRANGDLHLYRSDGGTDTQIASDTTGADLVVGSTYPITLEVTSTQVIATGNGKTISANDTTYRAMTCCGLSRSQAAVLFDVVMRTV